MFFGRNVPCVFMRFQQSYGVQLRGLFSILTSAEQRGLVELRRLVVRLQYYTQKSQLKWTDVKIPIRVKKIAQVNRAYYVDEKTEMWLNITVCISFS